jgi:hypothetical protein
MAKILGTIYLSVLAFYTVWFIIFYIREWVDELKRKRRRQYVKALEKPAEPAIDIVGKSTTAFLAPLKPIVSVDLEREQQPALEAEPDISPSDVEISLNLPPDEDEPEMYPNENHDTSDDLSQGLTFEQISHALDVVEGRKSDENDGYLAGEIFSMMPDDFLTVICVQTDHEAMVKKLIAGYLDFPGKMKPAPALVANFDINNYV